MDANKTKNLLTNPVNLSQPAGAALAFMGIGNCIPLWHGVQGCTAFGKILFIQHFREPIPFQTTGLTQTSVVMGGDDNITEALDNIIDNAEIVGILTTGVAETSGADVRGVVKRYLQQRKDKCVVTVNTADYEGCLETGYAKASREVLKQLAKLRKCLNKTQVALFPGPYFTPGEIEELRTILEDFGLEPIIFPDLGDSLGGYLTQEEFSPCTIGGTPLVKIRSLADSALYVSIGSSMESVAYEFAGRHGSSSYHFDSLSSLSDIDAFFQLLTTFSGNATPRKYLKQREHLLDSLLDAQFYLSGKKAALAGDPEFLTRWKAPLEGIGVSVSGISSIKTDGFPVGDLGDLEEFLEESPVDFLVGSTHVAELAESLSLPVVRAGIPVSDRMGEPQTVRIGYRGTASLYRETANVLIEGRIHAKPYVSLLRETL